MKECELTACASNRKDKKLIAVHENIGDAAFRTYICKTCAYVLGLSNESDLPDDGRMVNRKLRAYKRQILIAELEK